MKRREAYLKAVKAARCMVVGASSVVLFTTAFSTAALAGAKDSIDTLDVNPLVELVEKTTRDLPQQVPDTIQMAADTVSQDAEQLFNPMGEETSDPAGQEASASEEMLNPADENTSTFEETSDNAPDPYSTIEPSTSESLATSATANDEPIVIQGDTVIIQGDTTTTAIHSAMQSVDPDVATTILFKNQIVITTDYMQGGAFSSFDWLKYIKADEDASVSFLPRQGDTAPTLGYSFERCKNLESVDGLSAWDVSNVTGAYSMQRMFSECVSLRSLEGLSSWDVTAMHGAQCMWNMFNECVSLGSLEGLSAWNMTGISGKYCLSSMFYKCSGIISLDALSAWDVSNVSGESCMEEMFCLCTSLTSIDGIQNWNIFKAIDSTLSPNGANRMFAACTALASLTVNPSNGFQLTSAMNIPTSFTTGGNTWWPMKGAPAGCSTSEMIANSTDTATYGNRWMRSEGSPYLLDVVPTVIWTTTVKPYTGFNQTIGPDSVEVNGVELTPGVDYAVYYTKANTSVQEDVNVLGSNPLQIDADAYPVVREEGAYTARLYLQGKYVGKENPSYTQTVYVGDPGPAPAPQPEPTPTPEPTPASDTTPIPSTGDTTSMGASALSLSAAALLGMVILGLVFSMRNVKGRY